MASAFLSAPVPLPQPTGGHDARAFLGEKSFSLPSPERKISRLRKDGQLQGGRLGSCHQPEILPPDHGPQAGTRKDLLTPVKGVGGRCQRPVLPYPPS